jgi:hypothetical protein
MHHPRERMTRNVREEPTKPSKPPYTTLYTFSPLRNPANILMQNGERFRRCLDLQKGGQNIPRTYETPVL